MRQKLSQAVHFLGAMHPQRPRCRGRNLGDPEQPGAHNRVHNTRKHDVFHCLRILHVANPKATTEFGTTIHLAHHVHHVAHSDQTQRGIAVKDAPHHARGDVVFCERRDIEQLRRTLVFNLEEMLHAVEFLFDNVDVVDVVSFLSFLRHDGVELRLVGSGHVVHRMPPTEFLSTVAVSKPPVKHFAVNFVAKIGQTSHIPSAVSHSNIAVFQIQIARTDQFVRFVQSKCIRRVKLSLRGIVHYEIVQQVC
mmetsp:Transcript_48529/g.84982  ORF Transcript_48529/g.84982 Transcript_48529/m.84982 type:complete len:250 (-) Transcript_48529:184-933(-)